MQRTWAVVVGGGSAIGAALTKNFAQQGLKVLSVRRTDREQHGRYSKPYATLDMALDRNKLMHSVRDVVHAIPQDEHVRYLVQDPPVLGPSEHAQSLLETDDMERLVELQLMSRLKLMQGFLHRLRACDGRVLSLVEPQAGDDVTVVQRMLQRTLGVRPSLGSVTTGNEELQKIHNMSGAVLDEQDDVLQLVEESAGIISHLLGDTCREEYMAGTWNLTRLVSNSERLYNMA